METARHDAGPFVDRPSTPPGIPRCRVPPRHLRFPGFVMPMGKYCGIPTQKVDENDDSSNTCAEIVFSLRS